MTARDPFDTWQRSARRALRDHIRDRGQVPALFAAVSAGSSPMALRGFPSLHLLADALAVKAEIQHELRRHSSRFAAVAQMSEAEDELGDGWHLVKLGCFTLDREAKWAAGAHAVHGLQAWTRRDFMLGDTDFIAQTIAENARVAL